MISHGKAINKKCSFEHKSSFKIVPGIALLRTVTKPPETNQFLKKIK